MWPLQQQLIRLRTETRDLHMALMPWTPDVLFVSSSVVKTAAKGPTCCACPGHKLMTIDLYLSTKTLDGLWLTSHSSFSIAFLQCDTSVGCEDFHISVCLSMESDLLIYRCHFKRKIDS